MGQVSNHRTNQLETLQGLVSRFSGFSFADMCKTPRVGSGRDEGWQGASVDSLHPNRLPVLVLWTRRSPRLSIKPYAGI
jgi:hypothetical protein